MNALVHRMIAKWILFNFYLPIHVMAAQVGRQYIRVSSQLSHHNETEVQKTECRKICEPQSGDSRPPNVG